MNDESKELLRWFHSTITECEVKAGREMDSHEAINGHSDSVYLGNMLFHIENVRMAVEDKMFGASTSPLTKPGGAGEDR